MTISPANSTFESRFDHPIQSVRIQTVIKPHLTDITAKAVQIDKQDDHSQELISSLQKAMFAFDKEYGVTFTTLCETSFERLQTLNPLTTKLTAEGKTAVQKTIAIFQELTTGSYSKESAEKHAVISSNLLCNHLFGGAVVQQQKVDALYDEVMSTTAVTVTKRSEEECNNPSFLIACAKTKKPIALLKEPKQPYDASHQRVIENYPLYHSNTREIIGYELDALLGFDSTPATLKVVCENQENTSEETTEAVLQAFIPNGTVFSSFITQEDGGELLKAMDTAICQLAALAGIIKGVAAGHIGNYMMVEDPATKKLIDIAEFDHKECMVLFNKMPQVYKVRRYDQAVVYCEDLEEELKKLDEAKIVQRKELQERLKTERASIQMGRLSILGMPQNEKPLQKATLLILTHPSLQALLKGHQASIRKHNYEIQQCALKAQTQRVERLCKLAEIELAKTAITLTPRDLFFDIYGGRELFEMAEKKYYPAIVIFNNIIGSSYRPEFKDLSRPETMLGRAKDQPSKNPEAARNFQVLYKK